MICVSVTPVSRKLGKADILNASRHADMVELCLDHLAKEPDVGDLIAGFEKPILVSCRRAEEGGRWNGSEEQRQALLRQAIVAGPKYVELELDIARSIPRFGQTERVISYTSLDKPLGKIDSVLEEAARADADIVKFTSPTPDLESAWPLLAAVTRPRRLPVVGVGVGRAGVTFSLLGRKYGSPWIYAALEKGMEAHEGQATVFELEETYGWGAIDAKTRFVGVLGLGPAETAATRALNAAFASAGLNRVCLPLEASRFDELPRRLETLGINAVVVGSARSRQAVQMASETEEAARASGYADLLLKQKGTGWMAYNTLWRSALRAIEKTLEAETGGTGAQHPLDRRNVLVVGTGGMARAVAYGAGRRRGMVSITSPDAKAAQQAASQLQVRYVPFANLYDTLFDVVVFADAGLAFGHKKSELNPAFLRPGMTVLDVAGLPNESEITAESRQRECRVVPPSDVFMGQIETQFKAVTGEECPTDAVEKAIG